MSKPYHRPVPKDWFLKRPNYIKFMIREATSVFIGAYLVFLLIAFGKLGAGQEGFDALIATISSPISKVLHVLALLGAVWHSITWFQATPKGMPVFVGEEKLSDAKVAIGMGYLPWIVVSALIIWGVAG